MPSIDVRAVRTKGRDLELKSIFEHDDNAEMRADCVSARKDFLDDLRPRVGRDVEIFCGLAAQQIADAAAGVVRDVPGRAQAAHDLTSALFHRRFHGARIVEALVQSA